MVAKGSEPPQFPIIATDRFAIKTIDDYRRLCLAHGLREQADQVLLAIEEFSEWTKLNPELVKLPDHKHVPTVEPRPGFDTFADAIARLRRMPALMVRNPQQFAEMLENLATAQGFEPESPDDDDESVLRPGELRTWM